MKSERTYFFLSGLPRTGITLLGAILNQNPDIYVSPTSPVLEFMEKFREIIDTNITYAAFPKEEFTKKTISKIWNDWYSDIESPIIIDKNRGWPARLDWAGDIAKDIKIICPVRSILDILSSFVLLNRKAFEKKFDETVEQPWIESDYCNSLMNSNMRGVISAPYNSLAQLFVRNRELFQNTIHLVEYEDLISDTANIMNKIYDFLQIPNYEHHYDNIKNDIREDDNVYGMTTLHDVRPTISKKTNNPLEVLDEDIIKKYSDLEFWR